MIIKMDYFSDDNIVDLFNGLLPDNYFIYRTGLTDIRSSLVGEPEYSIPVRFCRKHKGSDVYVGIVYSFLTCTGLCTVLLRCVSRKKKVSDDGE